jgi:tRNA (cytidine/uridine-2'-O-)-methyltransferase
MVKVVLYQPQIPQNTGNVVRTCAVTGSDLYLVTPLGFQISDRWLKRAGLDYWEGVQMQTVDDLESLLESQHFSFYFFSSHAEQSYSNIHYTQEDWLIFGSETTGLPQKFVEKWPEKFVTLPMREGQRCLNLATSVGIAVYEAYRQNQFNF